MSRVSVDLAKRGRGCGIACGFFCAAWKSSDRPSCMRWLIIGRFGEIVIFLGFLHLFFHHAEKLTKNIPEGIGDEENGWEESRVKSLAWNALLICMVINVFSACLEWVGKFMGYLLRIKLGRWLTQKLMDRYFADLNFYKLLDKPELDNPSARIVDDMQKYVDGFIKVIEICTESLPLIVWAIWMMFYDQGGRGSSVAHFFLPYYGGWCLLVTLWLGRRLSKYKTLFLTDTAHFRTALANVQENAECIAFYGAQAKERSWTEARMESVYGAYRSVGVWDAVLKSLVVFTYRINWVLPYFLLMKQIFIDREDSSGLTLGSVAKISAIASNLRYGIDNIFQDMDKIAEMVAASVRVWEVLEAFDAQARSDGRLPTPLLRRHQPELNPKLAKSLSVEADHASQSTIVELSENAGVARTISNSDELRISQLTVTTPDRSTTLIEDLNLSLTKGSSILIVGPSGAGKSSLLRTLCGLWKAQSGSISMPANTMFLPQNAYIPAIPLTENSLRAQMLFPSDKTSELTDDDLEQILRSVNLDHLMGTKGIYRLDDWKKRLSNGEKQRLVLARLLAARPLVAFLDESTSALDVENESLFYESMRSLGCSYISVGHREGIVGFHDRVLEVQGEGRWSLMPVEEYRKGRD